MQVISSLNPDRAYVSWDGSTIASVRSVWTVTTGVIPLSSYFSGLLELQSFAINGLSADGSRVVGGIYYAEGPPLAEAFYLGVPNGPLNIAPISEVVAWGISGDGLTVVGAVFLVWLIWWVEVRITRRRHEQVPEAAPANPVSPLAAEGISGESPLPDAAP
jgi:hypothetical protein